MQAIGDLLRRLDTKPKTDEDFRVRTTSGAALSVVAIALMTVLFVTEFIVYMSVETVEHLEVDTRRSDNIRLNFDVTFLDLPCSLVSVDVVDVSGKHATGLLNHIRKRSIDHEGRSLKKVEAHRPGDTLLSGTHLADEHEAASQQPRSHTVRRAVPGEGIDEDGNYCGSCYGAGGEGDCCNTCDEVRAMYLQRGWTMDEGTVVQCKGEGFADTTEALEELKKINTKHGEACNMYGYVTVPRVPGSLQFAPASIFRHAQVGAGDVLSYVYTHFNASHRINRLSFGQYYPGSVAPLDAHSEVHRNAGTMQYYLKVVPTTYTPRRGEDVVTNQYSVTQHWARASANIETSQLPGVFLFYDFSPIAVHIEERSRRLTHFLTRMCAIIGGIYAALGMVDRVLHRLMKDQHRGGGLGKLLGMKL
jgi:hypothetical protein